MQIEYERGISNPGNLYRMKKLMARAEAGETLNTIKKSDEASCKR